MAADRWHLPSLMTWELAALLRSTEELIEAYTAAGMDQAAEDAAALARELFRELEQRT